MSHVSRGASGGAGSGAGAGSGSNPTGHASAPPVTPQQLAAALVGHIEEFHSEDVDRMLAASDPTAHYCVVLDGGYLTDEAWGMFVLDNFDAEFQDLADECLREVQRRVMGSPAASQLTQPHERMFKPYCHVRLQALPQVPGMTKPNVSSIRSCDVGRFIQVNGTVIRTSAVKMLEAEREYECTNPKCNFRFKVQASLEQDNTMEMPKQCPSSTSGSGGGGKPCKSTSFRYIEESRVCTDYQEMKIQEQVQTLTVGSIPRSIVVVLDNDLVDRCKAGDDVEVTGTVMHRWHRIKQGQRLELEVIIHANHVRISQDANAGVLVTDEVREEFEEFWKTYASRPLQGRNIIVKSVCQQMHGLFLVKLAVLLTLVGGVGSKNSSGMRTRGESHLLLVGDPGTGKSQFLRFAAKLCRRSVLTTGIGTTSAGLTCSATKDSGEWMLEAGALVLADRGLCCIDEFSSIREHDRATIHEAMEQQTLSVAKAGLVCTLNARATVLAATNPKGKYDTDADISVNTAIASPLLSRFDLVLVLLDTVNAEWDDVVSSFILNSACAADSHTEAAEAAIDSEVFPLPKLQAYLSHIKSTYLPVLTSEAEAVLSRYYELQRQTDTRNQARTTLRLLESLVRLTQAHARIMCKDEASLQDAVIAVVLVETSMHTSAMLGVDSVLHSSFPEDPDREYQLQEHLVLKRLGLSHLSANHGGGAWSQGSSSQRSHPSSQFGPSQAAYSQAGHNQPSHSQRHRQQPALSRSQLVGGKVEEGLADTLPSSQAETRSVAAATPHSELRSASQRSPSADLRGGGDPHVPPPYVAPPLAQQSQHAPANHVRAELARPEASGTAEALPNPFNAEDDLELPPDTWSDEEEDGW